MCLGGFHRSVPFCGMPKLAELDLTRRARFCHNPGMISRSKRTALFFSLAVIGAIADLGSKSAVFSWLGLPGNRDPYWMIDGVFGIQTAVNIGAVFGIGAGQGLFFAAFSIVAFFGILVWMFKYGGLESRWLTVALGMICGGIFGNLYDRLGLWTPPWLADPFYQPEWKSGVRDWILFRLEGVPMFDPWPNFNIADSLLVVGACMLFIHSFFMQPKETELTDDEATSDTASEQASSKV
jgi:signal peptidase II